MERHPALLYDMSFLIINGAVQYTIGCEVAVFEPVLNRRPSVNPVFAPATSSTDYFKDVTHQTSESGLYSCRHLSLSSNGIEKISNLAGLSSLRVLSLGRNVIKKLEQLEPVANTLEELWVSYNLLEKLVTTCVSLAAFVLAYKQCALETLKLLHD